MNLKKKRNIIFSIFRNAKLRILLKVDMIAGMGYSIGGYVSIQIR